MQRRKDHKGRVLKDGEVYRKSDGLYMYRWTAKNGKRHTIYDATLEGLREKEEIKEFIAEAIRLPQVWIYMIALVIVGWNLPAVRKGLNKDTDSSNKQKENR